MMLQTIIHQTKKAAAVATRLHRLSLFFIFYFLFSHAVAQVGSWQAYMSYHEPQQIVKAGNGALFVRASNSLYKYNLNDHSITTYDKVRQLNDGYIATIAWNAEAKRLVVVYQSSNMDLIDLDDHVTNINTIYSKSMTEDKTINDIYIKGPYAYLSTGFGIVKLNVKEAEITETYMLGENIVGVAIIDDYIYANKYQNRGMMKAPLNANLLDKNEWTTVNSTPAIFEKDLTDWNEYKELVATLKPGGPRYNNFGVLKFKNNRLYTGCGKSGVTTYINSPGTIQVLQNDEWNIYQDSLASITGWRFNNTMAIDTDPNDANHVFSGGLPGLFEYQDGLFKTAYNLDNSPLQSTLDGKKHWVTVSSIRFDENGSLWMLNSGVESQSILELTKDGQWVSHHKEELMSDGASLPGLYGLYEDSRGYLWFINAHWAKPAIFCYDRKSDQLVNIITSFVNQDGTSLPQYTTPKYVTEDMNGNIWVATSQGPMVIEKDNITTMNTTMTQVKVPRNDGTNYADYLLNGLPVISIAIDGGGRKWFGTQGNGLYLMSADNMTELAHFTTANSPLLSDDIEALAIDNKTGTLYIGTEIGLCSYVTDATEAATEIVDDNVYAYPNPVAPDYTGLITVVGLTIDSDVKVLSAAGKLVAKGRSNGGSFTWDGRDLKGECVASGVYMVVSAKSDGTKGTVCKVSVIK